MEIKCEGVSYHEAEDQATGKPVGYAMYWFTLKAGKSYTVFRSADMVKWVGEMVFTARPSDHRHPEIVVSDMPMWPKIVEN